MVLVAEARPVIVHSDVDGFEYFSPSSTPSPTNLTIGQRPRQSTGICVYQEREKEYACVCGCVRERERERALLEVFRKIVDEELLHSKRR